MTTAKVRADYDQLALIARTFSRRSESTQRMLNGLQNTMDTLQNGDWVGKGAKAFYAEMNSDVLPAMKRVVGAMNSAASTTTKISRIMKQAEDDAAALFRLDGTGTGTQVGGNGALNDVQTGNVSAFRRPGPDGGGSGASGGGSGPTQGSGGAPAPAKPKGQPGTKDKQPNGSDRFQGTDAQHDYIKDKRNEIVLKLMREQNAALVKFNDKVSDRLKLKEKIAKLQGKPEYKVRRAEFAKGRGKFNTEIDQELTQTHVNLSEAKRAYEAAKEALTAKPPEQRTLDDFVNVRVLELKADILRQTFQEMKHTVAKYSESSPKLPP